jgi:2-oxoglutarate ferredoxin oxidoreductase subunit delta
MTIRLINPQKCNGCGICVACCPMDVLRNDEVTKKVKIRYPRDCVACWSCESFCPRGCIDVSPERGRGEMIAPY